MQECRTNSEGLVQSGDGLRSASRRLLYGPPSVCAVAIVGPGLFNLTTALVPVYKHGTYSVFWPIDLLLCRWQCFPCQLISIKPMWSPYYTSVLARHKLLACPLKNWTTTADKVFFPSLPFSLSPPSTCFSHSYLYCSSFMLTCSGSKPVMAKCRANWGLHAHGHSTQLPVALSVIWMH